MKPIEKLVIATHNPGKLREIKDLLAPLDIACVGAAELDLPEPEEIGNTFVDNADLKAREAADLSGLPALADDSGLCVDALHGLPGIFSARWAEDADGNRDWMRAMEHVWSELEAAGPDASHDAHFACALSLARPNDGMVRVSRAGWPGPWSGRRAATRASATTRSSYRQAMSRRSARWTRARSTASAIGPTPSAN